MRIEAKSEEFYYDLSHKESRWNEGDNVAILDVINSGGAKILEIGCGTASILPYLDPDKEYTGVDISKVAVERAKKLFSNRTSTHFICGSFESLKINENEFDSVLAYASLEHVRNPKAMLDFMVRVLKPSGNLILTGPNLDLPWSLSNGVRHYSKSKKFFVRLLRSGDYLKRIVGILTFRTISENFMEATGKYEKPDDDLRYFLSSDEVIKYLKRKGLNIKYVARFSGGSSIKEKTKKIITLLPGMKYYGRGLTLIAEK